MLSLVCWIEEHAPLTILVDTDISQHLTCRGVRTSRRTDVLASYGDVIAEISSHLPFSLRTHTRTRAKRGWRHYYKDTIKPDHRQAASLHRIFRAIDKSTSRFTEK